MTAQRQREAQDCYAALGTKVRWFTEIHYAAGNWDRKCRVIANINHDLTSGKGSIADIESLNSYFRNVLKVEITYLIDKYGGQARNRTTDTGIFRASKINELLIMLGQVMFGTVRDYLVDSTG